MDATTQRLLRESGALPPFAMTPEQAAAQTARRLQRFHVVQPPRARGNAVKYTEHGEIDRVDNDLALIEALRSRAGDLPIMALGAGDPTDRRLREAGANAVVPATIPNHDLEFLIHWLCRIHDAGETLPFLTTAELERARPKLEILVADDNPVNRKLTQRLLEQVGHSVRLVENGREAVRAATERRFDVVLMDVQMPEVDGLEATAEIRALESRNRPGQPRMPIVAMTAHAMKGDRERFLNAGFDDYLSKPIRFDQLFAVLENLSASAPGGTCEPSPS